MTHPIVDAIINRLNPIREKFGEEAFRKAAEQAAAEILRMAGTENPELVGVVKEALKDVVNFDELDSPQAAVPPQPVPPQPVPPQPVPPSPQVSGMNQLMFQQLRQQMPGLQTQAQFEAFMLTFDALRAYMNHTFLGQKELAATSRDAVLRGLDLAADVTVLVSKLEEVPESATSSEAEKYKAPPKEFGETDLFQQFMADLDAMKTREELLRWYSVNRAKIDSIVDVKLRNELFDGIRAKQSHFIPRSN
jgi:hypothetical protein